MKITQDVRDYAATLGVSEEEALNKGMEVKAIEFVKKWCGTVQTRCQLNFRQCRDNCGERHPPNTPPAAGPAVGRVALRRPFLNV
jgi:hypothetical protein